jgi:hypothetical protein
MGGEGKGRGAMELLIGAGRDRNGQALNRIEEEVTAAVSGEIDGRRLKTTRP